MGEEGVAVWEEEAEVEEELPVELFREPSVLLNHEFLAAWISLINTPLWCSNS